MIDHIDWNTTPVLNTGAGEVTVRVGKIGSGEPPVFTIMALIHGDEPASLYTLYKWLQDERLEQSRIKGTIQVIPVANPLAAQFRRRNSMLDGLNANRLLTGDSLGRPTERVIAALAEIASQSTLVVNLHEFEANADLTCVYAAPESPRLKEHILRGIHAFSPPVVWVLPDSEEKHAPYLKTFETGLSYLGVPSFIIELPRLNLLTGSKISHCIDGLMRLLVHEGILERDTDVSASSIRPKAYRRHSTTNHELGIWQPRAKLLEQVKSGDVIGEFISANTLKATTFSAFKDGTIMMIRPSEVVYPNDILFSLGTSHVEVQCDLDRY